MAEEPFYSSQSSQYEQHRIIKNQENLESSPLKSRSKDVQVLNSEKPKKPPNVTPKRFTKFFTPRSTLSSRGGRQSKAGRQLRDITKNGTNRRRNTRPLQRLDLNPADDDEAAGRPLKRRRFSIDIASSPPLSSPLKHAQNIDQVRVFEDAPKSPAVSDGDVSSKLFDDFQPFPQPLRRLRQAGRSQRILQRSFGGFDACTRGWRGYNNCVDWRAEITDFVATPTDIHAFTGTALPFCTASCNTNSLIAVGEEEGNVRLIDSSPASDFSKPHLDFRPHHNAIMDITFSSDDYLLATASGDQTSRIVDMHTQQTVCILSGHKSSVKQVRFLPNDDNMITTSSRDGTVLIWDMRCGGNGSVAGLRTSFARNVDNGDVEPTVRYAKHTMNVGPAHRSTKTASDVHGVSITSLQHLREGREHLLLTTSEANASIKLWDLRNAARRGGLSTPLSSTPVPEIHSRTRNYGINSMALSSDSARLYTVCRDGNIYAYSSNHLVLGGTSELSRSTGKGRMVNAPKAGAGPLYGFKHPSMRMGTFYVRASIRSARGDNSEMLAVGSSDNCAILFPTNERHLPQRERSANVEDEGNGEDEADLPPFAVLPNQKSKTAVQANDIPVHEHGSALIRAHNKEVTSLTWTQDGELVTVSDDFTVRCWREDSEKARGLRACGEGGGRRWGCGWADVDATRDEDEG